MRYTIVVFVSHGKSFITKWILYQNWAILLQSHRGLQTKLNLKGEYERFKHLKPKEEVYVRVIFPE